MSLPPDTHIGHAHLQVADLERSLAFYSHLLGLREAARDGATAWLSADGQPPHDIILTARADAKPKPQRSTGLYHVAIRLPNRSELARVFYRLVANRWPFQGFSDHRVSEALYLADPDGNGLELYRDRPREEWTLQNGQVAMGSDPLDVDALLEEGAHEAASWPGIHPATDIGHVHLHVSDLRRAEDFYSGVLGLEVMQRGYPGALFVAAGGYHHHVGLNIWAGQGAPPPPPDAVGLLSFGLRIPEADAWQGVIERARDAGYSVGERHERDGMASVLVRDPDGIGVELQLEAVAARG